MPEKDFNLLKEGWVKVLTRRMDVKEVSLTDAIVHAHEYKMLAGEMPTQDFALFRLLLACVQTIFYRYDAENNSSRIDEWWDKEEILERWKQYWEKGCFNEDIVNNYLGGYSERFWLFHPETPFYQTANLKYGTDYSAQSLLGNLKSSNNRATKFHFSMYEGKQIERIPYPEAARWLIHLNGFSVNVKNSKDAPGTRDSAGVGRLGSLGLIRADGETLFEQLMLNLTPLNPRNEAWGSPRPIWECEAGTLQSIEIPPPDNLPQLYTLQSRRIMLTADAGTVSGFRALNGDHYPLEDDFNEPMTLWKKIEDKKTHRISYIPKKHSRQIQLWREFPSIFNTDDMDHVPGVVRWINEICENNLALNGEMVTFKTAGIVYADGMSYTLGDCLSDGIMLSADLVRKFSREWTQLISDEIHKCTLVSERALRPFAKKISLILNKGESTAAEKYLSGNFYSRIDHSFRKWLSGINPEFSSKSETVSEWERTACSCAAMTADEYIAAQGNNICRARDAENILISVPGAYNEFLWTLHSIYPEIHNKERNEAENEQENGNNSVHE